MKHNVVVQALALVVLASVIAIVANAFASRTRMLVLPGYYPNALRVPPREPERVPPPPRTETAVFETTTTAAAPAPVLTTTTTTTTAAPAVTATTATTTTAPVPGPEPVAKPVAPSAPKIDVARFQPHPDQASLDISGDEVAALHAAGALFLDARRTSVYEAGHIAGARSFSVWESDIDDKVNKLFEERPDPADQNKPIVIYCSGGACEDSHMLAQKLWGIQFNNVYVYKDGFPDWQKRGGAVRTGANP
ncbi:MAG TPA: rhodanese-like domain-containing protein [Thermoanaerobaculia bacterium]|nr:rhodanese-like domain-containing protein [Thermoanaerobaculia bacterium]